MERSEDDVRYVKGENPELDKGFEEYKKMRFQAGCACYEALSNEEVDVMIKLWKKATMTRRALSINDVRQIVVRFAFCVISWTTIRNACETKIAHILFFRDN